MSVQEVTPGNFRSIYGKRLGVGGTVRLVLPGLGEAWGPVQRCESLEWERFCTLAPCFLLLSSHLHPHSQVKELEALGGEPCSA